MDKLFIHDLKIETIVGAYSWERKVPQIITLDVEYGIDARLGAKSDDLDATCNYISVGQCLTDFIKNSQFYLVETLAERCAELVLEKFALPWVKLRVRKAGTLANAKEVGVEIERERQTA